MSHFDLISFRQMLNQEKVIMSFEGTFSQGILIKLVETIKEKLAEESLAGFEGSKHRTIRKIYSVFIELAQNIQNYSSERCRVDSKDLGVGIVIVREDKDCIFIHAGNMITHQQASELTAYCNEINLSDSDEVKKLYRKRLRAGRKADHKGAGLGLLEIRRKSSEKLGFECTPVDSENAFFVFTVRIKKED